MQDSVDIKAFIKEHFDLELKTAFEAEKTRARLSVEEEFKQRIDAETAALEEKQKSLLVEKEAFHQQRTESIKKEQELVSLVNAISKLKVEFEEGAEIQRKLIAADAVNVFSELMKGLYRDSERKELLKERISEAISQLNEVAIKVELSSQLSEIQGSELEKALSGTELVFTDKLGIDEAVIHSDSLTVELSTKSKLKVIKDHVQDLVNDI